jgi:dienelactone hydrolase
MDQAKARPRFFCRPRMMGAGAALSSTRVGVVGQSLGALYAPLAAAGEPRLMGCTANCGPFDWFQRTQDKIRLKLMVLERVDHA